MIAAIADTHTAIRYLFSDPRLGKRASAFIDDTIAKGDYVGVSAISIAEMVCLIEKGRIPGNALNDLHAATADPRGRPAARAARREYRDEDGRSPPAGSSGSSRPRYRRHGPGPQRTCLKPRRPDTLIAGSDHLVITLPLPDRLALTVPPQRLPRDRKL